MSKIIVTGASGYLGRHVVRALADLDAPVVTVAREPIADLPNGVEQLERDLWSISAEEWSRIAAGATVIHLAWRDGFRHDSDAHMTELSYHFALVRALIDAGMERFVSIGSMHEVGPAEGEIVEEVTCAPVSQYGIAKNAFRLAAAEACGRAGVSFAWLRCFYILGDDERNHSVFTKLLERAADGDAEFPLTAGTAQFDFIEVDELGRLISEVSLGGVVGTLNLGSGVVRSLREQIEFFISDRGLAIEPKFGAFPERNGISMGAWPNLSKLRSLHASPTR